MKAVRQATRALPKRIRVDNSTEFTSKALDHWASGTGSSWTSAGP